MDYLGRLLLAIERARPWNGAVILGMPDVEYAITPMPCFVTTPCLAELWSHTHMAHMGRKTRV